MKRKIFMVLFAFICISLILGFTVSSLQAVSGVNKKWCEDWCKTNPHCHKCSDYAGCGVGYEPIATFKWTLDRDHWYACHGPSSELNKKACEDWCNQHKSDNIWNCEKCSPDTGCGIGYRVLYTFSGHGKNWHACVKTDFRQQSEKHQEECEKWCIENRDKGCVKCDTLRYCGPGFESMKHFEGKGKNWHACKKK